MFFRVANPAETGVPAPEARQGVALRTVARSLALMQKEALIVSSAAGAAWRLASDEGAYLMGDDVAPCPLAFMSTGMVTSFAEEILALGRRRGIGLPGLRLVQDNYYTMEGSALRGTMVGGALPVDLRLEVDSAKGHDALAGLLNDAVGASPVFALLRSVLPSRFTLTHNGREIPTRRVASIGPPSRLCPEDCFERAMPAVGLESVRKNGLSPRTSEVTSSAGSSYAAEQSRRLHLRAICSIRSDGLKTIELQLLNPHGSIFHFLSEEVSQTGETGRAPDALTYVSAGVAFCFMTQFGRYAKIARKDLTDYRVVQDTRFSPGGVEAVETHVHLESGEDDDFAQTILDMAEQTCFLHALCRSELTVRTRIGSRPEAERSNAANE